MRKPLALSNWKMAMTVAQSWNFVREFLAAAGPLAQSVDVVICPPYTGLYPVARAIADTPLMLGGQDVSTEPGGARTGEVSAELLADVGCQWVMLGHWEARRHHGDDDETVNRKLRQALAAGLRPILLVGEAKRERERALLALQSQLVTVLDGCEADQVAQMVFVYEPEWTIGVAEPAPTLHVDMGCRFIRGWLAAWYGEAVGQAVRVIYGGSVSLEYASDLLPIHDLDGLGATRKGRDPVIFAQLVRLIAQAKGVARGAGSGESAPSLDSWLSITPDD